MHPARRMQIVEEVDLGTAELLADPHRPAGWVLYIDGVAQSYVDLDHPTHLEFGYVRRIATVLDALKPAGAPIDVLHLGGGALCIPRYIEATRPGSEQLVIEADPRLWDFVQRYLSPPEGVTVRISDGREAVESADPGTYDVIIADAFQGAQMPTDMTSAEHAALAARALRPDGAYLVNVTDLPALAFTRQQCATLRTAFADVCVLADAGMLRGRRFGNAVLVGATREGVLPMRRMARARQGEDAVIALVHGPQLDAFVAGTRPITDATAGDDIAGEVVDAPAGSEPA